MYALEAIADAGLEPRDIDFSITAGNPISLAIALPPTCRLPIGLAFVPKGLRPSFRGLLHGLRRLEQAVMAVASGATTLSLRVPCDLASTLPAEHMPPHIRQGLYARVMIPSLDKIYDRAYGRPLMVLWRVVRAMDQRVFMQYDLTADQIDDALNGSKSLRRGAVLNPLAWYETTVEEDEGSRVRYRSEYLKSMYNPRVTQYLRITGL